MNYAMNAVFVVVPVSVAVIAVIAFFGQRRMAKHRGVPREEFIAAFADSGVPVEIPATVYDYYKGQVFSKESWLRHPNPGCRLVHSAATLRNART